MKTPKFWSSQNFISDLLFPLGLLYGLATKLRIKFGKTQKVNIPVICIGNVTAGGTGKTPVSIAIASLLQKKQKKVFFVSRGYGGKLKNIKVDGTKHSAAEVGDEPLLLAQQAPVIVNADRVAGAQKAQQEGAQLILMDDGFQNPGLHKDLSFLVFDGNSGIGNGRCIPSGPLRETLKDGLKRAQGIIILGEDKQNIAQQVGNLPVFYGKITATPLLLDNKNVIAFAGIGKPEKFYKSLQEQGFNIIKTFNFGDHHQYTRPELENLLHEAHYFNTELVTTTKDYVKIPTDLQKHFHVLKVDVCWESSEKLEKFILTNI